MNEDLLVPSLPLHLWGMGMVIKLEGRKRMRDTEPSENTGNVRRPARPVAMTSEGASASQGPRPSPFHYSLLGQPAPSARTLLEPIGRKSGTSSAGPSHSRPALRDDQRLRGRSQGAGVGAGAGYDVGDDGQRQAQGLDRNQSEAKEYLA
ncbi:hypothetical protein AXG93_977s1300 [Marchantia polymorpha subsp. ruderalis]|uniref:Uncharacterized protein n=1 Tax=Marchantia polymorpha subsp. ruderalis TaxID=1480154 RepID=A0A176WC83_MARPO|nr:hypothetical protein AXG93_977s1300 [Marchantia polymorpha subsp. ruderalis]